MSADEAGPPDRPAEGIARRRAARRGAGSHVQGMRGSLHRREPAWLAELETRRSGHATFNETRCGERKFPATTAAINDLPVAAIDRALVFSVLKPIWHEKPETATRARRIESVLSFATVSEYRSGENPARWRGHLDQLLPSRKKPASVKHYDAVPYAEMPSFMAELRGTDGVYARALEFMILTAARTAEVVGARWEEFDLDAKVWTVPAERMKAGKEQRPPLSDRSARVLSDMPALAISCLAQGRVGPSQNEHAAVRAPMRGMGATVHGFRSTFRDWAAEQTAYPSELCEMALAHAVGSKVEGCLSTRRHDGEASTADRRLGGLLRTSPRRARQRRGT